MYLPVCLSLSVYVSAWLPSQTSLLHLPHLQCYDIIALLLAKLNDEKKKKHGTAEAYMLIR